MQQTPQEQKVTPFPFMHAAGNSEPVANTYFVYKDGHEFVRVEAITAGEAIVKSEVENPFKITRYDPLSQVLLNTADLGITLESIAAAAAESVSEEVVVSEEAPTEAAAEAPAEEAPPAE